MAPLKVPLALLALLALAGATCEGEQCALSLAKDHVMLQRAHLAKRSGAAVKRTAGRHQHDNGASDGSVRAIEDGGERADDSAGGAWPPKKKKPPPPAKPAYTCDGTVSETYTGRVVGPGQCKGCLMKKDKGNPYCVTGRPRGACQPEEGSVWCNCDVATETYGGAPIPAGKCDGCIVYKNDLTATPFCSHHFAGKAACQPEEGSVWCGDRAPEKPEPEKPEPEKPDAPFHGPEEPEPEKPDGDEEVAQENAQLKRQVAGLTADLTAAKARAARAEGELRATKRAMEAKERAPPPPETPRYDEALKPRCNPQCQPMKKPWKTKCRYAACASCAECSAPPPAPPPEKPQYDEALKPRCSSRCQTLKKPWTTKCRYAACASCAECAQ